MEFEQTETIFDFNNSGSTKWQKSLVCLQPLGLHGQS